MASSNHVSKIAIVGAGGNLGRPITEHLLETNKHTITALTRHDSTSKLPEGVISKAVDYERAETLVEALKGQEVLIITLGGFAPKDSEEKLVRAAAEAGVPWIMNNEWSPDSANETLVKDVWVFQPKPITRKPITDLGKSSHISLVTGFWYPYMQSMPTSFGFDFTAKTALFFDEGETPVSFSTIPQIARAVTSLLSLPVTASPPSTPSLQLYRNSVLYLSSFTCTQKDMLASTLRVTNDSASSWNISKIPSRERYTEGVEGMKKGGDRSAFAKVMATRVFFPDGCGDFEKGRGTVNEVLGLKGESLDEATREAIEKAKKGGAWKRG